VDAQGLHGWLRGAVETTVAVAAQELSIQVVMV